MCFQGYLCNVLLSILTISKYVKIKITTFFFFCCQTREGTSEVQEVLSSIRESSESEGAGGSDWSLAACGENPSMPSQQEVVRKTEKVTKKIQELLVSAQEGKHNRCSEEHV